nr:MAG TPA: hypothetical protein [Caudoviricetes sp.]
MLHYVGLITESMIHHTNLPHFGTQCLSLVSDDI